MLLKKDYEIDEGLRGLTEVDSYSLVSSQRQAKWHPRLSLCYGPKLSQILDPATLGHMFQSWLSTMKTGLLAWWLTTFWFYFTLVHLKQIQYGSLESIRRYQTSLHLYIDIYLGEFWLALAHQQRDSRTHWRLMSFKSIEMCLTHCCPHSNVKITGHMMIVLYLLTKWLSRSPDK